MFSNTSICCLSIALMIVHVYSQNTPVDGVCGANAVWSNCSNLCPRACDNIAFQQLCFSLRCGTGCRCNDGYVFESASNQQGNCVPINQCANASNNGAVSVNNCTDANEEYRLCGSACEPSCINRSPICTRQCIINVCQCKSNYFRNRNGQCVIESKCNSTD